MRLRAMKACKRNGGLSNKHATVGLDKRIGVALTRAGEDAPQLTSDPTFRSDDYLSSLAKPNRNPSPNTSLKLWHLQKQLCELQMTFEACPSQRRHPRTVARVYRRPRLH